MPSVVLDPAQNFTKLSHIQTDSQARIIDPSHPAEGISLNATIQASVRLPSNLEPSHHNTNTITPSLQIPSEEVENSLQNAQGVENMHPGITSPISSSTTASAADQTELNTSWLDLSVEESSDTKTSLPWKESLALAGVLGIIGGSMVILLVLSFLSFLWFGFGPEPEATAATWAWRQIALKNWMTQAITLSSLALRSIVSLQAGVCTSMIAALVLEKHFAQRSKVAWLSVMRGINDGPLKLVRIMISSKTFTFLLQVEFWLILLTTLTTFSLQFSSTILLSDLQDLVILGDLNRTQVPTFAETQSALDTMPDENGLSRTGLIQRSFLPFSTKENRTSIRKYSGNAMVMNSNVACIRPQIDAIFGLGDDPKDPFRYIVGTLYGGLALENARIDTQALCDSPECDEFPFACPVSSTAGGGGIRPSSVCLIGQNNSSVGFFPGTQWNSSNDPWMRGSSMVLVITSNLNSEEWYEITDWQIYEVAPGRQINITLCFPVFTWERKFVEMATSDIPQEPTLEWSAILPKHNTTDVQNYFGVTYPRRNHGERGILEMQIIRAPDDGPPSSPAYEIFLWGDDNLPAANVTPELLAVLLDTELVPFSSVNESLLFCRGCIGTGKIVHAQIALLFNDIIENTGRATNALQSYMTIVAASVYYKYLDSLHLTQDAMVVSATTVKAPGLCYKHGCPGFISVAALILVQLVYVAVTTALYLKQTRYSRYTNIWHAVSQLMSGELRATLEDADNTNDSMVNKKLEGNFNDDFVRLGQLEEGGKIGVVKHTSVKELPID
ncbi:hypothetical protein HD806DRAFT_549505 [Xylariaceae sp. AK1471]|nr:hypothetical protein HD806DRAFT_549505 [Xylariaceae sp. AK1471]